MGRIKVLASIEWFTPAYQAGGIISSFLNQTHHLSPNVEFWIVCGNRDLIGNQPVSQIENEWLPFEAHHVRYSSGTIPWSSILGDIQPAHVYVHGLFNGPFCRELIQNAHRWHVPMTVASHGMLAPAALAIKPIRKKAWLLAQRFRGTLNAITWHASSSVEAQQIQLQLPDAQVRIAANLPPFKSEAGKKDSTKWTFVSVGRIHPIKNYPFAARVLQNVAHRTGADIVYRIIGPEEDAAEVQRLRTDAPNGIRLSLDGPLPPSQLSTAYQSAHALLVPSLTENYGQVVAEALAHGLPVFVSDQTPWTSTPVSAALTCLPLEPNTWSNSLVDFIQAWDSEISNAAHSLFDEHVLQPDLVEAQRKLFP